jgi:hypothetical protein
MDYTVALAELDNWSEDIAKFVYYLRNLDFAGTDPDRYHARNDMLSMIQLFCQCLEKLHRESTVCRQRKKPHQILKNCIAAQPNINKQWKTIA